MTPGDRSSTIIATFAWVALGIVMLIVAVVEIGVSQYADGLIQLLPDFASVKGPLVALAFGFGICVEVLLTTTAVLVGYIRSDRIFRPSALRWVDVLVLVAGTATVLVLATLFFIPGPPQLFLLVAASVPVGATVVLVLLVMRTMLRRAVAMHVELEEVV
jgi:hypothetical protein